MSIRASNEFFKRIGTSEKELILLKVLTGRSILTCRPDDSDDFFHASPTDYNEPNMTCVFVKQDSLPSFQSGKIFVNFKVGNSRYFITGTAKRFQEKIVIDLSDYLFLLQRRKNARVQLPDSFPGHINLAQIGNEKAFITAKLRDISAGGCRFYIQYREEFKLETGMELQGFVRLGNRNPVQLKLTIRHLELYQGFYTVGAQFLGINNSMENRLLGLMIDLQRELFIKYNS